jgi:hypothetical protein
MCHLGRIEDAILTYLHSRCGDAERDIFPGKCLFVFRTTWVIVLRSPDTTALSGDRQPASTA